ncbi:hypothetical protein Pcinc_034562 [Petrolisthes cinctipes]|uniref:Uncharacterized protein n=1 Tax=Petrolisthes cinctipes TaxID=88211 RepID=A0AAE1BYD2_PETCI|nr:hypothetical protein Pcinc_034562 [Petrolisthes cinctipes]
MQGTEPKVYYYAHSIPANEAPLSHVSNALVTLTIASVVGVVVYFSRDSVRRVLLWVSEQEVWIIVLVYVALFTTVSLPLMWGYIVVNIAAGYMFGTWRGLGITVSTATLGVLLGHLFIRGCLRQVVERHLVKSRLLRSLLLVLGGTHAFRVIAITRLTPIPFGLQNAAFAVSKVPTWLYLCASVLGLFPTQLLNSYLGTTVRNLDDVVSQSSTSSTSTTTGWVVFAVQTGFDDMMNGETPPTFTSDKEEADYWRQKAMEFKQSLEETREELEEFQSGSRDLEAELEAQLEQSETRCSEYQSQVNRLALENDALKERLERLHNEFNSQVTSLQSELSGIKSIKDELTKHIRKLEQDNDDLDRAKRATVASLEDFEARLNLAIERNAFLESELDEKEELSVSVQRLKDETRDLRQELSINKGKDENEPDNDRATELTRLTSTTPKIAALQKKQFIQPPKLDLTTSLPIGEGNGGVLVDSNKMALHSTQHTDSTPNTPGIPPHPLPSLSNGPMTPSSRISALNIVGDLLRKVGALESRLASCRTLVKEQQRPLSLPPPGNHSASLPLTPSWEPLSQVTHSHIHLLLSLNPLVTTQPDENSADKQRLKQSEFSIQSRPEQLTTTCACNLHTTVTPA